MATVQAPAARPPIAHHERGHETQGVNVGEWERWGSLIGGGLVAWLGLRQRSLAGLGLALLGGNLIYRGLTGHCHLYGALGLSTAEKHGPATRVAAGHGVKLVRSITIERPAEELYNTWRHLERLPQFMKHLVSVAVSGSRSHWVARGPAGTQVEWDAEIINDEPNRLIAWRSLPGSQVSTAGSVQFKQAPGGRGTEMQVTLKYDPPGGRLGSWIAWLFGEEPGLQIDDDLRRFKQLAQTGETASVKGRPNGRH